MYVASRATRARARSRPRRPAAAPPRAARPRIALDLAEFPSALRRVPSVLGAVPPVGWLVCLFLLSALVYAILGTQHVVMDLVPDEVQYAKLSQNFALGAGLQFRGVGVGYPPLYPIVLSWVWHFGSTVTGYQLAKVFGAVLASTVVFPVWLLARELVGPRLAFVPAALCVTGAWMATTAFVISENLAYPLAVASLACTVMALRDTRVRWVLASAAFGVLAALARTELLALPVILALALVLDIVRQPGRARWARIQSRPRWLWVLLVAGVLALLVVYAADQTLTGYPILRFGVTPAQALKAAAQHAITALNLFAFLPIVAAVALMARAANWRDDAVGPVLVTLVAAASILILVLGLYEAHDPKYPVDRYGMYLAPLLFLALVLAPGRIGWRVGLAAALGVAVAALWTPLVTVAVQQPALIGSQRRLGALGLAASDVRIGYVVLALVVGGAGVAALTWRRPGRGLAAAVGLVAAVLVTQSWTSQAVEIKFIKGRRYVAPQQLDWVDQHVHGPAAEFNMGVPQNLVANPNDYTDFYNKTVNRVYSFVPTWHACPVTFNSEGVFRQAGGPYCAPWPRYLVILRGDLDPTFANQRVLVSTPIEGTLVQIPAGPPRLLSVVRPPCRGTFCFGAVGITLFLHAPGTIALDFGVATGSHVVRLLGTRRRWLLPAGRENVLQLSVGAGPTKLVLPVNWSSSRGAPVLGSVFLTSAGQTTSLYNYVKL